MRRHEYTREQQQHQLRAAAYQQELLRRNMILSQNNANIKRTRHDDDMVPLAPSIYERRYSLESQPNVPVYNKFIYPQHRMVTTLGDSLNSFGSDGESEVFDDNLRRRRKNDGYADDCDVDVVASYNYYQGEQDSDNLNNDATIKVVRNLTALGRFLEIIQGWPLPCFSFHTACISFLIVIFIAPRTFAQSLLFPIFRLLFGTLYPAYASYKAVRTKNVKEYVKWMMYWIVFAFFTCIETFTDVFFSWFPLYYEVKVIIVLWLLSPATRGSSTLYRKFVHPMLTRREQEIDEYLNQAKERGYSAVLHFGSKSVNYATNVIMQTAIKGGGNLVQTIKRSYSLSDLSEPDMHRSSDEIDEVMALRPQQRLLRARNQTAAGRSSSGSRHSTGMYFTEVDVTSAKPAGDFNYNIRSTDDISSGYSSAEPTGSNLGLSRTSSMTNASKARLRSKRNEIPLPHELSTVQGFQHQHELGFSTPSPQLHYHHIDDIRDEVFMENEQYFQNLQKRNLIATEASLPIEPIENYFVDHQQHNVLLSDDRSSEDTEEVFYEATLDDSNSGVLVTFDKSEINNPIEEQQPAATNELCVSQPVRPVSPRELRATLEEIKDNFRAQIDSRNESERPKVVLHNKGRAPLPPSTLSIVNNDNDNGNGDSNYDGGIIKSSSVSSLSISNDLPREPSPARKMTGISNLFKNIKVNVMRSKGTTSEDQITKSSNIGDESKLPSAASNISSSVPIANKETEI